MLGQNPLNVLRPNWSAPANIRAFSTTRLHGVSTAPYDSLNLGTHVADSPESVARNRRILIHDLQLPAQPVWLDQVHSSHVVQIRSDFEHTVPVQADGAFSRDAGVVCAVLTADCLPIFITNTRGDRVAAIHAGWRGLAAGIIETAVTELQEYPEQLIAWGGPCIGPTAFEVGGEVVAQLGGPNEAYRDASNDGKQYVDLQLIAADRFKQLGVDNYTYSKACTYSDSEHFYSYRRDGECGRMASLIWMQS
ncbi:peptidoglycan editing factor PgeF [Arenicella xantha]|uniref:Purine nucleoside phosphorylase n=1 Tax=Arenicella xantha TaxID=644221 RepID=A0A395JGA2_9GAMM|nr:peptidoglycan editing factor PgeF [Arenicella xantha]RBP48475.1 hypothetical protein DFR28_10777 [Arenicella xantha]